IAYYFYAGAIAVIAVAMNTLLTLAMMSTMGASLTLAGIAGLVLSVGMGVDANVLINERIREELAKGSAMRMAIKLGYEKAFGAMAYGLGYIWNTELTRPNSIMMLFGQAIMYCGPGILLLVLLIQLFRAIHASFQKGDLPRMPMLHIIRTPKIDWHGARWAF